MDSYSGKEIMSIFTVMRITTELLSLLLILVSCNQEINESRPPISKSETVTTRLDAVLVTDTIFENNDFLITGQSGTRMLVVPHKDSLLHEGFKVYSRFEEYSFLTNLIEDKSITIYRKNNNKYSFNAYPSDLYKKRLVKIVYDSHPLGVQFKQQIETIVANGINFGGKYTIASWGCGTACQQHVIIDRSSGLIVHTFTSELGIEFQPNSLLILKNNGAVDPETGLMDLCSYCKVTPLLWDENTLVKLN